MKISRLSSILAAAALAACGDEAKPNSVPDVTVAYGGSQDTVSIDSTSELGALALSARDGSRVVSGSASAFTSMAGAVKAPAFGVKQAMDRVAAARRETAASFVGGLSSASAPCEVEGTWTLTLSEYDTDPATTHIGDYWELAFSNCWNADGSAVDGSFRLTATANGGDWMNASSYSTFGFGLSFANLVTVEGGTYSGLDGDMEFTYVFDPTSFVQSFEMSGSEIAGIVGDAASGAIREAFLLVGLGGDYSDVLVERYTDSSFLYLDSVEWGFNGGICSTEMGGCLAIETDPLFAQDASEPYPYAGVFTISDGTNSVQIEAYDGASGYIYVSYDLNGDLYWDATWDTSWSCLETQTDASACFTQAAVY